MDYSVEITDTAAQMLTGMRDRRIRRLLASRIDRLANEPDRQGRPLGGELTGRRSCRAVGQRYRIIYRIDETVVIVVAVGLRRAGDRNDVYVLAERLARLGLL
ncbi:MAG: plasmid stabilization protein [SAR202 cluster bacterium Io17-Chloro-G4]|nr:MAG: plasmid stabilization protein [SAR202 cluster bacterium Io17-Chloro-G4]